MKLAEDITPADLSQWIDSGYFWFRTSGENVICRALSWPGPGQPFAVQNIETGMGYTVPDLNDITLHWPTCGYVNLLHSKFAIYLKRLQRRQWCRTYNSHCISLAIPGQYTIRRAMGELEFNEVRGHLRTTNAHIVKYAFTPTYFSYPEAQHMLLNEGWYSVALNSNCLLCKSGGSVDVYYRGEYAGILDGNRFDPTNETIVKKIMKVFGGYVTV